MSKAVVSHVEALHAGLWRMMVAHDAAVRHATGPQCEVRAGDSQDLVRLRTLHTMQTLLIW